MSGTNNSSIEETIFNNMPGFGADDNTEAATNTAEETSAPANEDVQPKENTANNANTNDGGGSSTNNTLTQQPNNRTQSEKVRKHDGLVERANPDNPNTRDLVDPVTGRIVARGGIERRVYEEGQRHLREANDLRRKLQEAETRINSSDELTRTVTSLGLKTEDAIAASRVMSDFLRDPVRTLEYLIAEVKSKGYQLPFLEQGISPGVDTMAINRMLENKLAPILSQHQQQTLTQQQAREQEETARRTLDNFLIEVPYAEANLATLADMMQRDPGLTLHTAYIRMAEWAARNGLDHTQPLLPQIEAINNQSNTQQPTEQTAQQATNTQHQPPIATNRQIAVNNAVPLDAPTGQYNENSSWADILKAEMRKSGYSV